MKIKMINNQKGSSSVLVVLTLLMLVLFGVLGMISAFSDYKISLKNAAWTEDYYRFEALANEQLATLDTLIQTKQGEARAVEQAWKAGDPYASQLTESQYQIVKPALDQGPSEEKAYRLIYAVLMSEALEGLGKDSVVEGSQKIDQLALKITTTIILESKRRYIVQLDLLPQSQTPYDILMWREVPEAFDYSEGMQFEDVEVIGS